MKERGEIVHMETQELREIVNPVFNTAKSCVQLVAASGDKDAQKLLEELHFEPFGSKVSARPVPQEMVERVKRLFPAYSVLVESRFQTMNRMIESRKETQIVDLPCGYTSRGIRLSREGRIYFGFDLPAVIDAIRPAVEHIIGKNDRITYHAADATNYDSLESPFSEANRNFLITTEGLLMYFSQPELEEVFRNIRRLLKKFGGSWITADRAYFLHDSEVISASLNHDAQMTAMFEAVTSKAAGSTADVKLNDNVFFDPDDEKVKSFISRMGFDVKEIPMVDYLPETFGFVSGDADGAVREVFRKMFFWELTVKEESSESFVEEKPFSVSMSVSGTTLKGSVTGRMDTLTAPELLKKFQEVTDPIDAIEMDVSDMAYISSAGLRVLLIMYKSLRDKSKFKLNGVRKEIQEILETTGFDQFFL